jgi:hypothetical protein
MTTERDKIPEDIMPVQNCMLCNNESSYKVIDHGRAKMFDCPQCNVFVVSEDVEGKLLELNQRLINKLSMYSSKCPNDQVFHIHSDELSNIFAHCVPELTL